MQYKPIPKLTDQQTNSFHKRIAYHNECWQWIGSFNASGYGLFSIDGAIYRAHRVAYAMANGSIDNTLVIDHTCRNRRCVNPAHMELVTISTNVMRGDTIAARHKAATHCAQGHEYTPENTYRWKTQRQCRTCRRQNNRNIAQRKRTPKS